MLLFIMMIFLKVLCFCSKKFAQIYNFSLCPSSFTPFRMIYEIRPNIPTFCLSTEGNLEWNEKRASLWWRKHCGFWKRKMFKSISVQLSFLWLCRSKGKSNGKNRVASVRWLKSALFTSKGTLHTQTFVSETMYFFLRIFVWIFCRKCLSRIHEFKTFCIPNIFSEMSDLWNY